MGAGNLARSSWIAANALSVTMSGAYCCTALSVMPRAMSIWALAEKPGRCLSTTALAAEIVEQRADVGGIDIIGRSGRGGGCGLGLGRRQRCCSRKGKAHSDDERLHVVLLSVRVAPHSSRPNPMIARYGWQEYNSNFELYTLMLASVPIAGRSSTPQFEQGDPFWGQGEG